MNRKYVLVFIVSMAAAALSPVKNALAEDRGVMLSAGYRTDSLNWNIAGNTSGSNPNVLSELKWTDVEIFLVKAMYRAQAEGNIYYRASLDYGWIYAGNNQDSDYNADNRSAEFSRSNNKADSGNVYDISAGLGYRIEVTVRSSAFDVMPIFGYAYNRQNLRITDGFQTIPATGPFAGLNSTYEARWSGPWLGVDLAYALGSFTARATYEKHIVSYLAQANWNLRTDFQHPVSFEHTANGTGDVFSAGLDYALSRSWSLTGGVTAQDWRTSAGTDRTFFSDGTASDTRLNRVNWHSAEILAGGRYSF